MTQYPLIVSEFSLDIPELNVKNTYFTAVKGLNWGLNVKMEPQTANDGKVYWRAIPGRDDGGTMEVTLRRAVTSDKTIWNWYKKVFNQDMSGARVNCSIKVHDEEGNSVMQWDLTNAWPFRVAGPDMNASESGIMYEEVSLVFEELAFQKSQILHYQE